MYESPVNAIITEMQVQRIKRVEDDIYRAIQDVHINVDKEELMKALQYDRRQYEKGYADGCKDSIVRFALFLKNKSFCCDSNDWHSFQAINVEDDLDDLVEEFLNMENSYD